MTLSYCWGVEAPLTLTKHTHTRLRSGIALADLPRAFRDAVHICRAVGVRYLWIDALCIFQDKADEDEVSDWQREAGQMHRIYSNTFCTISAAGGIGSSSSILRRRATNALQQDQISIEWLNQDGTTTKSLYRLLDCEFWHKDIEAAPVNLRAWVIQERMLSPRILHFTTSQVYWEFFQYRASEVYPDAGAWPWVGDLSSKTSKNLPCRDYEKGRSLRESEQRQIHRQWCLLVESYTACQLTVRTDKLVAFSAIARRMASNLQDEYLAGMWRRSLEHDLLWLTFPPAPEPPQPAVYVAPTWCWASVECGSLLMPVRERPPGG